MRIMEELSAEELVDRSGVTAEQLRRLVELGIITPTPQDGSGALTSSASASWTRWPRPASRPSSSASCSPPAPTTWTGPCVVFPQPTAQLTTTLDQTAAATGLPEDLAARLFDAWELPRPQPGQALRADDSELLQLAAPGVEGFGHDETALLGAAPAARRPPARGWPSPRCGCSTPRRGSGWPPRAIRTISWTDDLNQVAASMMASLEHTLILLYRRHFEHYVLDVTVLRAEAALERAGLAPAAPGPAPRDRLSRPDRLHQADRGARRPGRGRIRPAGWSRSSTSSPTAAAAGWVKLLGDGVMFHFPEPAQAVCCGLELVDRTPKVGLPQGPGVGLHSGPVVFQHGDYFGRTVNIAARITDHARPGEVLVSHQVVADARPAGGGPL